MDRIDRLLEGWRTLDNNEKAAALRITGDAHAAWRRGTQPPEGILPEKAAPNPSGKPSIGTAWIALPERAGSEPGTERSFV
jgi:hypothetical protein